MDQRRPPEHTLEVFADSTCVKDIVKAILHTIFFHRYFIPVRPLTRDLLDTTLPAVDDVQLELMIEERANELWRKIETSPISRQSGRGQLAVQFFEKRRRKTYFFGKGDEEVCWETWLLDVTVAYPRTGDDERKVRRAMEKSLQKTAMKIVTIVNRDKDHIPPITTSDQNPFPYQISVDPKSDGWGQRMGLF